MAYSTAFQPNNPYTQKLMEKKIIDRLNRLADEKEPFLFVINYAGSDAYIRKLSEIDPCECLYDFEGVTNVKRQLPHVFTQTPPKWEVSEMRMDDYRRGFDIVKSNILRGNSYLANLTCKVAVDCNLSFEEIFMRARGRYKMLLRSGGRNKFVCFSPETFVRISKGKIYSFPMKGTLDASIPDAAEVLMDDEKEAAEHATIVDLIRNDLSRVAEHVKVDRYRYIDVLHTNRGDILQTSSEISGDLPRGYQSRIGDILDAMLPAGSITGAPKDKTMDIIHEAEGYDRGYYTGIMGIYNKGELNSAVMIRFLEQDEREICFKAGGGITSKSDCKKEYEEVLQKTYLPFE